MAVLAIVVAVVAVVAAVGCTMHGVGAYAWWWRAYLQTAGHGLHHAWCGVDTPADTFFPSSTVVCGPPQSTCRRSVYLSTPGARNHDPHLDHTWLRDGWSNLPRMITRPLLGLPQPNYQLRPHLVERQLVHLALHDDDGIGRCRVVVAVQDLLGALVLPEALG
eukprot:365431-Chlamydomonas_euryale.AAC.2